MRISRDSLLTSCSLLSPPSPLLLSALGHYRPVCQRSRFVTWSRNAGRRVNITSNCPKSCWISVCIQIPWTSSRLTPLPRPTSPSHLRRNSHKSLSDSRPSHKQVGQWSLFLSNAHLTDLLGVNLYCVMLQIFTRKRMSVTGHLHHSSCDYLSCVSLDQWTLPRVLGFTHCMKCTPFRCPR